jgi:hypothetical protein
MTMEFDWSVEPGPWNEWRLFDEWRDKYDSMTIEDQMEFHREFYKRWTVVHQHGDDRPVDAFFDMAFHALPVNVLEIGGWDGAAAARVLPRHPNIMEWLNVEFAKDAVDNPVCTDDRYKAEVPTVWPWFVQYEGYSVLFLQHVVEHMKFDQFQRLINHAAVDAEWVFIQSPLDMEPRSWKGYPGCHILEVGWNQIDEFMAESGFDLVRSWWDTQYSTAPENGRTRIYRRIEDAV